MANIASGKKQAASISVAGKDPIFVTRERSIARMATRAFSRLQFAREVVRIVSTNSLHRHDLQRTIRAGKRAAALMSAPFMNAQRSTRAWYLRLLRGADLNHAEQVCRLLKGPYRLEIRARARGAEEATTQFVEAPTLALDAAMRFGRQVELWRENKHLCTVDTIAGAGSMWIILPEPADEISREDAPRPFNSPIDKTLKQQEAGPAPCCSAPCRSASEQLFFHRMPLAHVVAYEEQMRQRRKMIRLRDYRWTMKSI